MRCSRAKRLIGDYIDGNLEAKEKSALEQHLKDCPDCQMLLEEFRGILEEAHELEDYEPSDLGWLEVKARLETETKPLRHRPSREETGLTSFSASPY